MNYTVVWQPLPEQQLADNWVAAADRAAVTAAAHAIEQALRLDPTAVGESRAGVTRVMIHRPLVAFYDVREAGRLVSVLTLRHV